MNTIWNDIKVNFKNGKYDGPYESYYLDNGQLMNRGNYQNGKKEGLWDNFVYDGKLRSKNCYKNDEEVDMSYCED